MQQYCEMCYAPVSERTNYPVCIDDNMECYMCHRCITELRKQGEKVEVIKNGN